MSEAVTSRHHVPSGGVLRRLFVCLAVSIFVLVGWGFVVSPNAFAETIRDDPTGGDCTSVGSWNAASKTCTLTTDLSNPLDIASNNVSLDGAGHTITGPGYGNGVTNDRHTGVIIKNLNIRQFYYGIYIQGAAPDGQTNATLSNNTSDNSNYGIYIDGSYGNNLSGNTMSGNTYNFAVNGYGANDDPSVNHYYENTIDTSNLVDGKPIYYLRNASGQTFDSSTNAGVFYCISCSNIEVRDLTLSKNDVGVYFYNTQNSQVENINSSNSSIGISLAYSNNNTITGGTTGQNQNVGISVGNSIGVTVSGSNASSNANTGIYMDASPGGTLSGNTVGSNNCVGISYEDSPNGNLSGNTINSNGCMGLWLSVGQ